MFTANLSKSHPYIKFPSPVGLRPRASAPWKVGDLCKEYDFPTDLPGGGVIGLLELGGGFLQKDLDQFSTDNGLPPITVTEISIDGTKNNFDADPNANGEVALDIQVAAASYFYATKKVPEIKLFWAANDFSSFVRVIDAALAAGCDVLSISWGADELRWQTVAPGLANQIEAAAQAAAEKGMVIFAAAGDNSSGDSDPGANVDVPSSCPHVVACGGTTKTRAEEVVWGDGTSSGRGTGGGYSNLFPLPAWQIGAPTGPGRLVPDVSANADPNDGYLIVVNGTEIQIGGTSAVAPFYAGLFAAVGKKLSFVTPTLWHSPAAFVDIVKGSNGAFSATVGPDACSGLGVPGGKRIAELFKGGTSLAFNAPSFPITLLPSGFDLSPICSVYKILRPILQAIAASPFLDPKKKEAILAFIRVIDLICPQGNSAADTSILQQSTVDAEVKSAISAYWASPLGMTGAASSRALNLTDLKPTICPVYSKIKPILDLAKTFVPLPWSVGIGIAEEVFDVICANTAVT